MKTENLSIGLRVLYHAIEWLTVFLILLIFAVQIITPLYAVRVGRADSFLQQLQWLPYRPGVLALGVMLAAVGTILSKCSHEVDSGFLSRSSWQLYLLEGVLYSASALIFQQNCDKIALFAIVDMVDDPRSLRQKRFLSAMIVVYLFCNMDAATSALHAVTLKQYLAFYSLHTRSVLQLVIESLSALEMILKDLTGCSRTGSGAGSSGAGGRSGRTAAGGQGSSCSHSAADSEKRTTRNLLHVIFPPDFSKQILLFSDEPRAGPSDFHGFIIPCSCPVHSCRMSQAEYDILPNKT
jgi:hypothetical protein